MKSNSFLMFICPVILLCGFSSSLFCQVYEDAVMLAQSEKWTVKQHKGLFGLAKPEFGLYNTLNVLKIDSPVLCHPPH